LRTGLQLVVIGLAALCFTSAAFAHCQVPCGIYDDTARIASLNEDVATISKAIANIEKLAEAGDATSTNQLIRWTNTKEAHASHIIEVVSEYFLTQKLKPVAEGQDGYEKYVWALQNHHAVLRAAMKTKQTVDSAAASDLSDAIAAMAERW